MSCRIVIFTGPPSMLGFLAFHPHQIGHSLYLSSKLSFYRRLSPRHELGQGIEERGLFRSRCLR